MSFSILGWIYSQLIFTPPKPTTSFKDKTIVVTGANRGLGLEASRHFVRLGASKVILGVRSTSKGQKAKADIEKTEQCPPSTIEVWHLDMASYDSVKDFAQRLDTLPRIDVFVASTSILSSTFELVEGHENHVTINVISTFLLTLLALPKLKETALKFNTRPCVVIIASEVHNWAKFREQDSPNIFNALDDKEKADIAGRYQDTKLMQILLVRGLFDSIIKSPNTYPVNINTVNPGFCHTEFGTDLGLPFKIMKILMARSIEVGSRTYVHAAAAADDVQGKYLSDCKVEAESQFVTSDKGKALAKRLWDELSVILEEIRPEVMNLI